MKINMELYGTYKYMCIAQCLRIINKVILNDLMAPNLIDRPFSKLTSAQNVPNSGSVSCADQFLE